MEYNLKELFNGFKESLEECLKEEIGIGRYGCRCRKCTENSITEAEDKGDQ